MPIGNKGSMNHLIEDFNLWLGKNEKIFVHDEIFNHLEEEAMLRQNH